MMYTMVIQVLAEFQLKITMVGEDITKKVILDQIWPIFGPSFVQIVPKIPEFEKMFQIYGVYHRNTSSGGVSAQNKKELT